jgi:hypothetical protein
MGKNNAVVCRYFKNASITPWQVMRCTLPQSAGYLFKQETWLFVNYNSE